MSKRLRAFSATIALFLLTSAFACTHLRHLLGVVADKPQVHLMSVDVKSISIKSMNLDFILEIFNPNSFSVDIEELQYSVRSLDFVLGTGAYKDVITLKSHDKIQVHLPFQVAPDNLVKLMKKYLENPKELKVKLEANLYLGTAIGKLDMNFQEEKTIMRGFVPN
ncbi:MAG: LEA type 2 family protein [Chitinophagaceae bacterium]|nr:LEA type 2 family protein [Oligoflexus sp.]